MKAERLQERVTRRLRQLAKSLPVGSRLPAVRQLMADWQISAATVRAAQNVLAHEGRLEIRHGSGVYVAEPSSPQWLAVVSELDLLHRGVGGYHRDVTRQVLAGLRGAGRPTEFYPGYTEPGRSCEQPTNERFWEDVDQGRISGVVFLNVPETAAWRGRLDRLTIPAVGAGTGVSAPAHHERLMAQAAALLRDRGRRRPAVLVWYDHAREMVQRVARDHGLNLRDEWLRSDLEPGLAGAGWEEFREIWASAGPRPDGLIVLDDMLFADAAIAIRELGIDVPDQLEIVTHQLLGSVSPPPFPVTQLAVDPKADAAFLVAALLARLDGREPPVWAGDQVSAALAEERQAPAVGVGSTVQISACWR